MSWAPVQLRWPEQATAFMADLDSIQDLAAQALTDTVERVSALASLATTAPGLVGAAANQVASAARAALDSALGEPPLALVVTPFQSGVGQGTGYQRYLSAPNLLRHMADKLTDTSDDSRPAGQSHALVLMFVATRYDHLASALSAFNTVLPMKDLQRAERRAQHLFDLEVDKWTLPAAGMLPLWGKVPLERCTVTKTAKQAMAGQLAALESYADSSPAGDLAALIVRKAEQAKTMVNTLSALKAQFAGSTPNTTTRARLIGPGTNAELARKLLAGDAPGHEWPLSAGVMLVGSLPGLSFVRELVGL
ncbi:hypothetical protein IR009_15735 [Pseudomonas putida]|uniref:hypothetical protein n=1 Tax=Pseudomonas putida group TaxID=136845 RepID=UPI0018A95EA6|nr:MULTISPECIES: hypothetical protein [Pseudomonas putida group]MBF8766671.1 hypothetical protein [Pseudomonas putida]MEC4022526.1 hypothetical protein [Pseudomonas fulva]